MANSDVRDVLKNPWVDPETMHEGEIVADQSYPPLPPRRPALTDSDLALADSSPPLPAARPEAAGTSQLSKVETRS